jgi:hypothetical protein
MENKKTAMKQRKSNGTRRFSHTLSDRESAITTVRESVSTVKNIAFSGLSTFPQTIKIKMFI